MQKQKFLERVCFVHHPEVLQPWELAEKTGKVQSFPESGAILNRRCSVGGGRIAQGEMNQQYFLSGNHIGGHVVRQVPL